MFNRSRKPLVVDHIDPTRCGIFTGFSKADLNEIVADVRIKTLQFSHPLTGREIEWLEHIVFSRRPDITLRIWGHHRLACDLSFLGKMPSVRKVSADCLFRAVGVEFVSKLERLEELSIGVYELESFEFLRDISPAITKLGLYLTASQKPSIAMIGRFQRLKRLYLEGQQKGIEAVDELSSLESIVLRSISTADIGYLKNHEKLWSVDVKLGGIKNFDALATLQNLKYLELWQIRGLHDLSFISKIPSLQNLFIQSLKQVTSLPDLRDSRNLRRIYLENLKGLTDLSSLEFAPNLTEFCYALAGNQKPENLLPVLRNKNVKKVSCGFGSHSRNKSFSEQIIKHGKEGYSFSKFVYV